MDVQQKLDEIVATVGNARSMPMSASCVVNRAELLAMLDDVREALPGSLAQAQEVLGGREQVVAEAQAEAQRIIESAHAERGTLVSGTEVAREAQQEADRILAEARREAEEVRAEADDYVDSKLANFEVVLSKTIGSVERGRDKLLGSGPGSEEWNEEYASDAPERTTDPQELRQRADSYVDARLGSVSAVLAKTLEAVGRGRQKLTGHRPADELGAHMAAQDEAAGVPHTSDADYLADLASLDPSGAQGQQPQAPAAPEIPQQQPPQPPQPGYAPVAAADPYAAGVVQDPQQGPYDAYYVQQDPDPYGYQQQYAYYGQQPDPYGYQQQYAPQQPVQQPQAPYVPQQASQLEETSLFDTSMIDLDQVREYEQRYGQGG